MATHYLFADEAGDFAFTRTGRASRYFMLCSVTTENTGSVRTYSACVEES